MPEKVDVKAVEAILYGVYKALDKLAGASAPAIMRQAAPDILTEFGKLGVDFSCVDDIGKLQAKLGETVKNTGLCDDITFQLADGKLTASIRGCSFFQLTQDLKKENIEPFGCPFAALTVALAERNLGKRAKVVELHPTEGGSEGDTTLVVELHEK
jgi:hypothetical protein